jgi:hypothetical protein
MGKLIRIGFTEKFFCAYLVMQKIDEIYKKVNKKAGLVLKYSVFYDSLNNMPCGILFHIYLQVFGEIPATVSGALSSDKRCFIKHF